MSQNSKQNQIEIPSGEYEGKNMRIDLPPDIESIVLDMQKLLYDYAFLHNGFIPEETSHYKFPGKHWLHKKIVLVYMMYLVRHWLIHAVDHQREINRKLREKIQNQ